MKANVNDRNELISISKQIYMKNRAELTTIHEFEQKYAPEDAILLVY
jgi:hypothetical protein